MKKTLPIICLLLICRLLPAQTYPAVGSPTILPAQPKVSSLVLILTDVTTNTYGSKINTSFTVNTNLKTIELEGCYSSSMLMAFRNYKDTFDLGQLAAGLYTVTFTAYGTPSVQTCMKSNNNSITFTLNVEGTVSGLQEDTKNTVHMVYPNPVKDRLFFAGDVKTSQILVIGINGQVLKKHNLNNESSMDISYLPTGLYLVRYQIGEKWETARFVKS